MFRKILEFFGYCFHEWDLETNTVPDDWSDFYCFNIDKHLRCTYRNTGNNKYYFWKCTKCKKTQAITSEEVIEYYERKLFSNKY